MRYLVTGAAGQVGSHLLTLLAGQDVVALDMAFPTDPIQPGLRRVTGDITSSGFLDALLDGQSFDVVFHLAGLNALQTTQDIYRVNTGGTAALCSAMTRAAPSRLVLMSSSAVYGASPDDPITEASSIRPLTHYAVSKVAAEMAAEIYGRETGRDVLVARPFNIVGPRQRAPLLYAKVAAQLVEIQRGIRPPLLELGNLDGQRDFIDVRDVCSGLLAIAEHGRAGQAYNLCNAKAMTSRAVVEYLCQESGLPVDVRTAPRNPVTDLAYQRGSHEKLTAASGWQPRIAIEKSLSDTFAYWLALPVPRNS